MHRTRTFGFDEIGSKRKKFYRIKEKIVDLNYRWSKKPSAHFNQKENVFFKLDSHSDASGIIDISFLENKKFEPKTNI